MCVMYIAEERKNAKGCGQWREVGTSLLRAQLDEHDTRTGGNKMKVVVVRERRQ